MTDAELIAYLRLQGLDKDIAAADRIEALVKDKEQLGREVNMARYGQPDFAWSVHKEAMADLEAKLAKVVEALEEISEHDTGATAGLAYTAKHHLAEIKSGVATTPYGLEGENHE